MSFAWYPQAVTSGSFDLGNGRYITLSLVVLTIITYIVYQNKFGNAEPYSDFHLALNALPGHENERPSTEWLNMGLWDDTDIFPVACEALALRVAQGVCVPGGHVLDVGHGSGDSLLLQLQHPSLPRPATLTGITSIQSQHTRSLERIRTFRAVQDASEKPVEVTLYHGDAVNPTAGRHPLDPELSKGTYDTILALDCAYHFTTRELFLAKSFGCLVPGGKISLADMCFEPTPPTSTSFLPRGTFLARRVASLLSVPSYNFVTRAEYVAQLREIGYVNIELIDISGSVFPGFSAFLSKRGVGWRIFVSLLRVWSRGGGKFVLVKATKPQESQLELGAGIII